jgi:uncharacterized membrane protein (DUF485 family)
VKVFFTILATNSHCQSWPGQSAQGNKNRSFHQFLLFSEEIVVPSTSSQATVLPVRKGANVQQSTVQERIRHNPKFARLVAKRTRLAIVLSLTVLVPYYAFMMVTAFKPALLALPISEGSIITIGWPIGALIIVGSWLTTAVYIRRANGEFDTLNQEILEEAAQ